MTVIIVRWLITCDIDEMKLMSKNIKVADRWKLWRSIAEKMKRGQSDVFSISHK